MGLREQINDQVKEAMKAKDQKRLGTLRLINAAIKDRCEEQPVLTEITEVGSYRFFGQ